MSEDNSNKNDLPVEFLEFREAVFRHSSELVEWCTVPITFYKDGETTLDRTGILLAIGDFHFLITAEHYLKRIAQADYLLFIPTQRQGQPEIPLHSKKMYLSGNPLIDVAVFPIEDVVVEQLKIDYRFLRLNHVRLYAPQQGEGECFLVTGYPQAKQRRDAENYKCVDTARYLTVRYEGNYEEIDDFIPTSHIVLEYDKISNDTSGLIGAPPAAPGLSGCGIWYLPTPYGIRHWRPEDIKLVGIQTSWWKYKFLKGTIISHVLEIIWNWFPDTRAPMELNGIHY